jgi:hypothetical protein
LRYSVVLTAAAAEDFRRLDGSLKEPVAKQLRKLRLPHGSASILAIGQASTSPATTNSTQRRNQSVSCTGLSCTGLSTKRSWSKSSPLESEKNSQSIRKPSSG